MRIGALLLLLLPQTAHAFSAQGHRWFNAPGEPVPYQLDPAGSADVMDGSDIQAIRRAFQTWESVSCAYLSFSEVAYESMNQIGNDGRNVIYWSETDWAGPDGTLALTYAFYTLGADPQITSADIVVNGENWSWTTVDSEIGQGTPGRVDVETVMFHEIGHFFGLDHSNDSQAAMFASNNKLKQREPAADDIAGICALYSNGQPVPDDPTNPGGTTGAPVGSPCQSPVDCASNICVNDELINQQYCSAPCALERMDECPSGFLCEMTQQGPFCLAPAPVEELCDQCSDGSHCASGLCVTVPDTNFNRPFCSKACDPTPGQPQTCPEGYQCMLTQQATTQIGACVPNTRICDPQGKGGHNEPCFGNGSCKPGHMCLEFWEGTGFNFCYGVCTNELIGRSCGIDRTECRDVNIPNIPACLTVATAGQPCMPEICDNFSFCAYDEDVGVDSALCYPTCPVGDCPANFSCTSFPGIPPLCVPNAGFKFDGESCAGNAECQSGLCQNIGQARLCTATCAMGDPNGCQPGLSCVPEPGSSQGLCWPDSISDPNAADPTRNVGMVDNPPGYCGCDFTNACDAGCACDPECADGCGCTAADQDASPWPMLLLLPLAFGVRRRRR